MSETSLMSEKQKNLVHSVEALLPPLKQIADKQKQKAEKNMPLKKAELQLKNSKGFDNLVGAGVGFCILGIVVTFLISCYTLDFFQIAISSERMDTILIMILICGLFVGIGFTVIFSKTIRKKSIEKRENVIIAIRQSMKEIDKQIFEIACSIKNDVIILPPDYQYYFAADYIYSCLRNCRASSMKEAVNLYEDQLHKWKMENYQEQLLVIQQQQQASLNQIKGISAVGAAASVAGMFL